MEQLSFLEPSVPYPTSYDDIQNLYERFIYDGETDDDVFTWNEIQGGRSYSFYDEKVFEFIPKNNGRSRIKIPGRLFPPDWSKNEKNYYVLNPADMPFTISELLTILKAEKERIFLELNVEQFGCCNDFMRCSDAKACLYPEDRFFNGCMYRKNLEAGKIFYGKNKNA